jgi:hypothetical protein
MKKINKNFLKDSHFIKELKLCSVRLIDNSKFPWIILIPKRKKNYRYLPVKENGSTFIN